MLSNKWQPKKNSTIALASLAITIRDSRKKPTYLPFSTFHHLNLTILKIIIYKFPFSQVGNGFISPCFINIFFEMGKSPHRLSHYPFNYLSFIVHQFNNFFCLPRSFENSFQLISNKTVGEHLQ